MKRYTAVTYREPVWAGQCRQCMHLRQYRGGRIWKCSVLTIARGVWRPAVGYCADARAPDGICGPHGRMFQAAQGKGEQA